MSTDEPQFLTPQQVAKILQISPKSVIRKFGNRSDVIDLGQAETLHKRGYRVLRIPRSALNRFMAENRAA